MADCTSIPIALVLATRPLSAVKGWASTLHSFWFPALLAVLLAACAVFLWRRRRSRRADEVSRSTTDEREVRIVSWSKSRIQFLREAFAPETHASPLPKAHDRGTGIDRKLNTTDIRDIAALPYPAVGSAVTPQETSPRSLRVATVSTTAGRVTIAYAEERVPRNWRAAMAALLAILAVFLYALHRDRVRNDLTYTGAQSSMAGAQRAGMNANLSMVSRAAPGNATLMRTPAGRGTDLSVAPKTTKTEARSTRVAATATNRNAATPLESRLKSSRAYYDQACLQNDKGASAEVIDYCTRAIQEDPYYAQAYCLRAMARVMSGDFKGTVADCSKAIEVNPRYIQAYYFRGGALDASGEMHAAIADYTKAIEFFPSFADAYNARAWSQYRLGDLDQALRDVNQAIHINSTSANAYDTRGWTKFAKGDKGGAVADCCRAVLLDRQGAVGYNSGGLLYYIAGEYGDALATWTQACQLDPSARVYLKPWMEKARELMTKELPPGGHVLAAW